MSKRYLVVDTNLERIATRWKWLRFLQHFSTLGSIVSLLTLVLGICLVRDWITSQALAVAAVVLLSTGALVALAGIALRVAGRQLERGWLASSMEGVNPTLLDRLNTLVFFEGAKTNATLNSFTRRIAKQTRGVLERSPLNPPFSAIRSLMHLCVFLVVLAVTVTFYQRYTPLANWSAARQLARAEEKKDLPEPPANLELPETTTAEQVVDWGEVRITEPGRDLRVTKSEVVPMQIEVATSRALTNAAWLHTLNGGNENGHPLPQPKEPRFAIYQPALYLDELQLAEWDVLTYYARASTDKSAYASEVYFIEVRPFHEDILKIPGGQGGKARQGMNELSSLIERQQQIIRDTHKYRQQSQTANKPQEQDRGKLSQSESDLRDATKHLAAELASGMNKASVRELMDELDSAGKTLDKASGALRDDLIPDAQQREREALNQLVSARKYFQKLVSENPDEFGEESDKDPMASADAKDKLERMAEFRNEEKAAREFVKKSLEKQKSLAQRANRQPPSTFNQLAPEEKVLEKSLENFQAQHPRAFRDAEEESKAAVKAMNDAAKNLEKRSPSAKKDSQQAAEKLEQLQQAMEKQNASRQLADAYKLKEMLDRQIKSLGQCQNGGGSVSDGQLEQTASAAKATTDQLKKLAEEAPTRDAFGPKLREALSNPNKLALDRKLDGACQASGDGAKRQAAGQAKSDLEKVAQAFKESQPQTLQEARKNDSLQDGQADGFERGLEMLESLARRRENNKRLSPQEESKQQREALRHFQKAVPDRFGNNEQSKSLLVKLEDELKEKPTPLDDLMIEKLIAELKHFSTEVKDSSAPKPEDPQMTNIDPAKLPPAYRGRIEKYFQRLSEKK